MRWLPVPDRIVGTGQVPEEDDICGLAAGVQAQALRRCPGRSGKTVGGAQSPAGFDGGLSAYVCRIEQGGHRGGDEAGEVVGSDPRAGAGAVEDQAELSRQQIGIGGSALFGLGPEVGRQLTLDSVGHLARGVAPVLELDLRVSMAPVRLPRNSPSLSACQMVGDGQGGRDEPPEKRSSRRCGVSLRGRPASVFLCSAPSPPQSPPMKWPFSSYGGAKNPLRHCRFARLGFTFLSHPVMSLSFGHGRLNVMLMTARFRRRYARHGPANPVRIPTSTEAEPHA